MVNTIYTRLSLVTSLRDARQRASSVVGEAGPQSLTSEVSTLGPEVVTSQDDAEAGPGQRKRSHSLADIQVPFLSLGGGQTQHKKFTKTKSEESGYDSDTTRKSGSGSPRGSVKSGDFETESASSTDLSSNAGQENQEIPSFHI